jgi:poly-gamma-glutamate capsule biosynthesis protein CapA/YwtB (metallophosphatase superfamily)
MRPFRPLVPLLLSLSLLSRTACGGSSDAPDDVVTNTAIPDGAASLPAEPEPEAPRNEWILQATGDVILHTALEGMAARRRALGEDAYGAFWSAAREVLHEGDLNFVNMETPVATLRNPLAGAFATLNGSPDALVSLRRAGFHVAFLANNHAYDQTAVGITETKAAAERAGLRTAGGDASESLAHAPIELLVEGLRVAVFSFTETVNGIEGHRHLPQTSPRAAVWDQTQDLANVRAARADHDLVVVAFHWGEEFRSDPTPFQLAAARSLCDAGVDWVVGSHPHVLQRVDILDGPDERRCVVANSLGNFVSNQGLKYRYGYVNPDPSRAQGIAGTRDAIVMRLRYARDEEGVVVLRGVEGSPFWAQNNWETRYGNDAFVHEIALAPLGLRSSRERLGARLADERLLAIRSAIGPHVTLLVD